MESAIPPAPPPPSSYPVTFSVDYPDRDLNRLSSFFRVLWVIPIAIILHTVSGVAYGGYSGGEWAGIAAAGGVLFMGPLLMILFRQKYPVWWVDWNRELVRFTNRVHVYAWLMTDTYPSTDDQQSVRLDFPTPNAETDLSRGMPLVKWFLAIPHYIVLVFLFLGALISVILAWFAILFTGRFPRGLFDFVEGVLRWALRVEAYAFLLVTDEYPPFSLRP